MTAESKEEWKARMGIGEMQNKHHTVAGQAKVWSVTAEEGPRRGQEAGRQREHWDGRIDAKVQRGATHVNPDLRTKRVEP